MTLGWSAEIGHRVDHAEHLEDALDAVEVAELLLHHRDEAEPDRAGVLIGLLERDGVADLARDRARAPPREEQQIARAPARGHSSPSARRTAAA